MDTFTFSTTLRPQYRDLDPNGHVNQAIYSSYFEQARADYWQEVIGMRHDRAEVAVVRVEIEFSSEIALGDELTVYQRVEGLGRSSIPFVYKLTSNGELAATGSVVLIAYDREKRTSKPIPVDWREAIEAYEGHELNDECRD